MDETTVGFFETRVNRSKPPLLDDTSRSLPTLSTLVVNDVLTSCADKLAKFIRQASSRFKFEGSMHVNISVCPLQTCTSVGISRIVLSDSNKLN